MATTTINVPKDLQHHNSERLIKFLRRGEYDVEYREERNKRLKGDRDIVKSFKEIHGDNWKKEMLKR